MDPIKLNIHRKSNRCQLFRVACKLLTEILPMSWKNTHTTKEDYSEKLMKTFTYDSKLPKCFRFVTCAEKLDHFGNGHKTGKPNIYQQCSHSSRHFIVTRTMHLQQQRYLKEHQLKQKYIHALGEVGSSIEYIFHALLYGIFCTKNHKKYGYSSTCHEYIVEVEVQLHSFLMEYVMSGQPHSPATLSLRKEPLVCTVQRLHGTQGWSGCFGEEKNLVLLPGIETWIIQSIAQSL